MAEKKREHNILALDGVTDKEYVDSYGVPPKLANTPEINNWLINDTYEKNLELETEMLLSLMVFLGSDESSASKKIHDTDELDTLPLEIITSENGYASLVFPYNKVDSWRLLGWALDELGAEISDRDSIDGSYYIKVTPDKGFFSKIINTMFKRAPGILHMDIVSFEMRLKKNYRSIGNSSIYKIIN